MPKRRNTPKPVHAVALDAMQERVNLLAEQRGYAASVVQRMKADKRYNRTSLKAARATAKALATALKAARTELRTVRTAWKEADLI